MFVHIQCTRFKIQNSILFYQHPTVYVPANVIWSVLKTIRKLFNKCTQKTNKIPRGTLWRCFIYIHNLIKAILIYPNPGFRHTRTLRVAWFFYVFILIRKKYLEVTIYIVHIFAHQTIFIKFLLYSRVISASDFQTRELLFFLLHISITRTGLVTFSVWDLYYYAHIKHEVMVRFDNIHYSVGRCEHYIRWYEKTTTTNVRNLNVNRIAQQCDKLVMVALRCSFRRWSIYCLIVDNGFEKDLSRCVCNIKNETWIKGESRFCILRGHSDFKSFCIFNTELLRAAFVLFNRKREVGRKVTEMFRQQKYALG